MVPLKQKLHTLNYKWIYWGYRLSQSLERLGKALNRLLLWTASILHPTVLYSIIIILSVMVWQSRKVRPQKFLQGLWSKKKISFYSSWNRTSEDILTQFSTTLRPLTSDPGFWEIFHRAETHTRREKTRGCQNFLSTDLKISTSGSWTGNYGQCLTKGDSLQILFCAWDNRIHPEPRWVPIGALRAHPSTLGEVCLSQPSNLQTNWPLWAPIESLVPYIPRPVPFPNSFTEEINSDSGSNYPCVKPFFK